MTSWLSIEVHADAEELEVTRTPLYGLEVPNRFPPTRGPGPAPKAVPTPRIPLTVLPVGWSAIQNSDLGVEVRQSGKKIAVGTELVVQVGPVEEASDEWRESLRAARLPETEVLPRRLGDEFPVGLYLLPPPGEGGIGPSMAIRRLQDLFAGFDDPKNAAIWDKMRERPLPDLEQLAFATEGSPARVTWSRGAERAAVIVLPCFALYFTTPTQP